MVPAVAQQYGRLAIRAASAVLHPRDAPVFSAGFSWPCPNMAELKAIPKRDWATSEEVVKLLERLLDSAKRGEIVALAYVADRKTSDFESGSTRTENCFAMAGYLFNMGLRLMGFVATQGRDKI